ncbi:patatin-like phospholipase family protein [Treponema pectinovorum]|uniref:patatin-like phospholipase family protein n=1 Tax=Treponema pectinovorum TaxID=164 RepID=UPI003D8D9055
MKNGLVLEGGGMRGMFTSGVIDVFLENDIKFDGAIGVSAGATFGCNYKSKQQGRALRYNKKYGKDKRYCSLKNLLLTGDLFGAEFCYKTLPQELDIFDFKTYKENPMEFYCVVSDCKTGKPIYKKLETCIASEMDWLRASASLPIVSRVVKIDGNELLDGGITDSIPLKAFEDLGYQKNVVILTQPKDFVKKASHSKFIASLALRKYPLVKEAWFKRHEVYNAERDYVFEREKQGFCLAICPKSDLNIGRAELNPQSLQRVYDEGRLCGIENLNAVKEFLRRVDL